jgi:hypothetical protein
MANKIKMATTKSLFTIDSNISGKSEAHDQYDGGYLIEPIQAHLEKNSLPEILLSVYHRKSISLMLH